VASRATLKTWTLAWLGTSSGDPLYNDTRLDALAQQAYDAIVSDLHAAVPHYLSTTVTLAADGATAHTYSLAGQAPTFAKWLEVRHTDATGSRLTEARLDELEGAGSEYFAFTGPDQSAVLHTSPDTEAGTALWMRYAYWPTAFADDNSTPDGLPSAYHDVVALEMAVMAYGFGGEQRAPAEVFTRWQDRRHQMFAHAGRRGVQPSRTRMTEDW